MKKLSIIGFVAVLTALFLSSPVMADGFKGGGSATTPAIANLVSSSAVYTNDPNLGYTYYAVTVVPGQTYYATVTNTANGNIIYDPNNTTSYNSGRVVPSGNVLWCFDGSGGGLAGHKVQEKLATINTNSFTGRTKFYIDTDFGATGHGADDTTAFEAWSDSGKACELNPALSPYLVKANINPTNGCGLIGNYATVLMDSSVAGYFFNIAANVTNGFITQTIFDGQKIGFNGGGPVVWALTASTNIIRESTGSDRYGILVGNTQTNYSITQCTFQGFNADGMVVQGLLGAFPGGISTPCIQLAQNNFIDNWEGLVMTNNAEYVHVNACNFLNCGRGVTLRSGNDTFTGGIMTDDGIAVYANGTGANNVGRGSFTSFNMNHTSIPFWVTNVASGLEIKNCTMMASGWAFIQNATGVTVANTEWGISGGLYVDSADNTVSGNNYVINCTGNPLPTITLMHSGLCYIANNYDVNTLTSTYPRQTNNGIQVFTTNVFLTTGAVVLSAFPSGSTGPSGVTNGNSGMWNSNNIEDFWRTSTSGSTTYTDHPFQAH